MLAIIPTINALKNKGCIQDKRERERALTASPMHASQRIAFYGTALISDVAKMLTTLVTHPLTSDLPRNSGAGAKQRKVLRTQDSSATYISTGLQPL